MEENTQNSDLNHQPQIQAVSFNNSNNIPRFSKLKKVLLIIFFIVFIASLILMGILYLNQQSSNKRSDIFKNYVRLSNQADQIKMSEYINKVISKNIPEDNQKNLNEFYGIFSGFDKNYVQIVSNKGVKSLLIAKNLNVFVISLNPQQASASAETQGEILEVKEVDKKQLFNKNQFGKLIQIILTSNSKSVQTIFINN